MAVSFRTTLLLRTTDQLQWIIGISPIQHSARVRQVVLVAVGITLLGGLGQALAVFLGIAVMAFALMRAFGDHDVRREPPVPPGAPLGMI